MRRGFLVSSVAVVAAAALTAAYWYDGDAPQAATYRFAKVEQGPLVTAVSTTGTVNAEERVASRR